MEWPLQNEKTPGKPLTTPTNQAIWMAAMEAASVEKPEAVAAWKERMAACGSAQQWRSDYLQLIEDFVRIQAQCSSETILKMCQAGLEAANNAFVFRPPVAGSANDNKTTVSLQEAFSEKPNPWEEGAPFETKTFTGNKQDDRQEAPFQLASPYGTDENPVWLNGGKDNGDYTTAAGQLDAWSNYGCMEPSAAEHAKRIMERSDIVPLVRKKTFVLLGLTSEMGPALHLLKIPHAHVLGIARAGKKIDKLVQHLETHGATSTTLQIPSTSDGTLGANLLTQGPQIARWIVETAAQAQQANKEDRRSEIVLLPLAYMDGEANVRVTVAMDQICLYVQKMLAPENTQVSLAYLTSPATCYTIPPAAARNAKERYDDASKMVNFGWPTLFSALSFGKWLQPVDTWKQLAPEAEGGEASGGNTGDVESNNSHDHSVVVLNGMVHMQGPNYALAKTMQQWRCMIAAANGGVVSAPHAPPTRTYSMQHNSYVSAGLEGLPHVSPPLVAFDVLPCSSLMTAIMLNQLEESAKDDKAKNKQQHHPMELFWDGSVHGGGWRTPYNADKSAKASFLVGKTVGALFAFASSSSSRSSRYPPQSMGPRPDGV